MNRAESVSPSAHSFHRRMPNPLGQLGIRSELLNTDRRETVPLR